MKMVYDVTPDGGVARFNEWLETQLANGDSNPEDASLSEDLQSSFATIAELQRRLLDAKATHNSKVPVLQLPVEILANIFISARDIWPTMRSAKPLHYNPNSYRPRYSWMRVGEVCRRFRTVALDHPILWTSISDDACPSLAYLLKVALPRARTLSKSVTLRIDDKEMSLVSHLLRASGAIHELCLLGSLSSESLPRDLKTYFDCWRYADEIRVLKLDLTNDVNERIPLDLPPLVGVRELNLAGVLDIWNCPMYGKLKRLTLTNTMPTPSAAQLRALLKRTKCLQDLTLERMNVAPEGGKNYVLPESLNTFKIVTPSSLGFAQSISPRRRLFLTLQCLSPPHDNPDEHQLKSIAERWLGHDMHPAAASIRFAYNTTSIGAELCYWRSISSALAHSRPDVTIKRYIDETYTLSELMSGVYLGDLVELDLNIDCVSPDDYTAKLKDTMDAMPNLHTLRLTECLLANVFKTPSVTDGLRQLHTLDVRQSPTYRTPKEYVQDEVRALAHWLQHRRDVKCPAHTLILPRRVARGMEEEGFANWEQLVSIVQIV